MRLSSLPDPLRARLARLIEQTASRSAQLTAETMHRPLDELAGTMQGALDQRLGSVQAKLDALTALDPRENLDALAARLEAIEARGESDTRQVLEQLQQLDARLRDQERRLDHVRDEAKALATGVGRDWSDADAEMTEEIGRQLQSLRAELRDLRGQSDGVVVSEADPPDAADSSGAHNHTIPVQAPDRGGRSGPKGGRGEAPPGTGGDTP